MQSNDKPINGQPINGQHNPNFLALLNQVSEPPVIDQRDEEPSMKRFARLRAGWDASWERGGFLHERWEDVRLARCAGWHGMATWIKAVLSLATVCAFLILLDAAGDIVSAAAHRLATTAPNAQLAQETSHSFWAVIDTPVRSYLAQHTSGLAVSGPAVYALWQAAGLFGLIGGFLHSTIARIIWTLWGAATITAVWSSSPADGRTIATGIAILAWTIASGIALSGLSLRPLNRTVVQPHIHIPPQPSPVHDDLDDEPTTPTRTCNAHLEN
ncbi:hypothetical protein ACH4YN_33105 [Streptomyces griseofuscus]|uniref:hypothetical protein n=1 Tax=Streptomyces griseofuscus TaxID=146922 RepID=UPI003796E579